MHIIKDENGNVCPHGHEHGHAHTHDDVCQEGCSGCESHEHHAAELDQMADKLRKAGMDTAAEQIRKAVDEFQKGNLYLSVALATVKEN